MPLRWSEVIAAADACCMPHSPLVVLAALSSESTLSAAASLTTRNTGELSTRMA